jgi:arylsulfatase A-like enzyme
MRLPFAPARTCCLALALGACVAPDAGVPGEAPSIEERPAEFSATIPSADDVAAVGDLPAPAARPRRVLLVVADDISAAATSMYAADYPDVHFETAPMPTVEALCSGGVRFRQAWSAPTCAPTRAGIMTGRHGFRNGGVDLMGNTGDYLPVTEPTLPRLLTQRRPDVAVASFGKYNLGHTDENGGDLAPNEMGWSHYAGALDANVNDYFEWQRTIDGVTSTSTTYATTQTVDDTIAWLEQQGPDQSWMVWVAFNAPHAPFHLPPADLHDYDHLDPDGPAAGETDPDRVRPYYLAASQAMDTELGRLVAWLRANGQGDTDILFVADNGAPPEVSESPLDPQRAKGTVFEGGVHVPFCVAGPSVGLPGRVESRPVSTVDLLATVLDLEGAPAPETLSDVTFDGQSLAPILRDPDAVLARDWAYTEVAGEYSRYGAARAVVRGGDKLIEFTDADDAALYDLTLDPFESDDRLLCAEDDDDADHGGNGSSEQAYAEGHASRTEASAQGESQGADTDADVLRDELAGLIDTLTAGSDSFNIPRARRPALPGVPDAAARAGALRRFPRLPELSPRGSRRVGRFAPRRGRAHAGAGGAGCTGPAAGRRADGRRRDDPGAGSPQTLRSRRGGRGRGGRPALAAAGGRTVRA